MVIRDGRWFIDSINHTLPEETLWLNKSIPMLAYTSSKDMLVWGAEPSRVYTTCSGYCFLDKHLVD